VRKHTKIKKYECDVCLKRFYLPTDLKYHKRIHTGERPFECSICAKRFKRPSTRATHMRSHIEGKKFECDYCEYTATTSQNIRTHTASKHTITQHVNVNVASSYLTTTTSSSVAVAVGPLQSPMALPIIGGMRSSSSGDVLSSSFPMNSETFPLDAFFEFESESEPHLTDQGGNTFPQILPPSLMDFLEQRPNHNNNTKRPRNEEDDGSATSSSSSSSSSLPEPLQVTKRIKI